MGGIMKHIFIFSLVILLLSGCSNGCKTYYTPVDHAKEYMNIDVSEYKTRTYQHRNGETFEAIVYEKCEDK